MPDFDRGQVGIGGDGGRDIQRVTSGRVHHLRHFGHVQPGRVGQPGSGLQEGGFTQILILNRDYGSFDALNRQSGRPGADIGRQRGDAHHLRRRAHLGIAGHGRRGVGAEMIVRRAGKGIIQRTGNVQGHFDHGKRASAVSVVDRRRATDRGVRNANDPHELFILDHARNFIRQRQNLVIEQVVGRLSDLQRR